MKRPRWGVFVYIQVEETHTQSALLPDFWIPIQTTHFHVVCKPERHNFGTAPVRTKQNKVPHVRDAAPTAKAVNNNLIIPFGLCLQLNLKFSKTARRLFDELAWLSYFKCPLFFSFSHTRVQCTGTPYIKYINLIHLSWKQSSLFSLQAGLRGGIAWLLKKVKSQKRCVQCFIIYLYLSTICPSFNQRIGLEQDT